jgi:hypothetical protein
MSNTALAPKYDTVHIDSIRPNDYNPNRMNDRQYAAELESIQHFGFIDPITIRETDDGLVIIDGEHRWRGVKEVMRRVEAGEVTLVKDAVYDKEKGWRHKDGSSLKRNEASPAIAPLIKSGKVPVANLGRVSEVDAKRLTIILNETRGTSSALDLSEVLSDINRVLGNDTDALQIGMAYGENEISQLLSITPDSFGGLEDLGTEALGSTDFLDEFDDVTGVPAGVTPSPDSAPAPSHSPSGATPAPAASAPLGEALFNLNYPVNEEQRNIILQALGLAKSNRGLNTSIDALIWVCMEFIREQTGDEINYDF